MGTTVKLSTARELVEAGSVRGASIIGQAGGYAVVLRVGKQEKALAAKAGHPRLFAGLDAAARVLHEGLGVARFDVDASGYSASDVLRRRRPDRAVALRELHAAAEHDAWFRREVQQALREADDPATEWVSLEAAEAEAAEARARYRAMATEQARARTKEKAST